MKLAMKKFLWTVALAGVAVGLPVSCTQRPEEAAKGQETPKQAAEAQGRAETGEAGVIELAPEAYASAGIQTGRVEVRPLAAEIETTGQVGFNEDRIAHVSPRVAGRLTAVRATLGQRVAAGQTLAVIDSVELGKARADYLQAKAREELTRATFDRESRLAADKISSQKEVLEARAAHLEAEAALRNAEETLHLFGLTAGQIEALRDREPGASLMPILTPFAGTVVEKEASLGEMVGPEKRLFTVADLRRVWISIDVFEKDLRRVHLDDGVSVEADAYPGESFQGKVSFVGAQVDPGTRTIRARIDIDNANGRLRPGMFARVKLTDPHAPGGGAAGPPVATVPESAIQRKGSGFVAFVPVGERRFQQRAVSTGRRSGGFVEVINGLKPGEQVVVQGVFLLLSEASKQTLGEGGE
jgi:cobalt-zinc-cadmium efflux system membrane fusion protein